MPDRVPRVQIGLRHADSRIGVAKQSLGLENVGPRILADEFGDVYYSDDVAAAFTIRITGGDGLVLSRETDAEPAPLTRVGTYEFPPRGLTLNFVKDPSSRVTELTLDAGSVRGIRFKR